MPLCLLVQTLSRKYEHGKQEKPEPPLYLEGVWICREFWQTAWPVLF
jgi:hypothetical protein